MLVSIVIPNYNYAAFVSQALDSVLKQTYNNWECIVVDDGSRDNSVEIVNEYVLKDPRIKVVRKTNGGLPSTRNEGIKVSNGEYIAFLDSDDLWTEKKIEHQVNEVMRTGAEIVFSDCEHFSELGKVSEDIFDGRELDIYDFLAGNPIPGCSSSIMVRKELFYKVGFFDNDMRSSEDLDMLFRFCLEGYKFSGIPKIDVRIRKHGNSMQANYLKMYVNKMYCFDKSLRALQDKIKNIDKKRFEESVLKRFQSMLWTARDCKRKDLIHYSYYRVYQLLGLRFFFKKKFAKNYIYDLKLKMSLFKNKV